ncbi:MAG: CHAT domain-containing protein, partial [Nannocystaceae bacterium]
MSDITTIYSGYADAEQLRTIGDRIREFLVAAKVNLETLNALTICSDAEEIYGLPFELASRGSVSLGTSEVALRYRWPDTKAFIEGDKRGRVLFAWASPKKPVPNREHCTAIQKTTNSWLSFDSTRDVVANASREGLRKALSSDVRVLHLLCHGGPGGLRLEGEDITSPTALATTLEPFARTLRMIVLCVCRSGDQEPKTRHMGSTARELHRLGIPWVVASRSPLHFQDSVLLTEKIYAGIRNSVDDIEAAIVSARRALHEPCGGTARTGCRKYAWLSLQLYAAPASLPPLRDTLHPHKEADTLSWAIELGEFVARLPLVAAFKGTPNARKFEEQVA